MKNIKLEDNEALVEDFVNVFFNILSCEDFDFYPFQANYGHCLVCFRDRSDSGMIIHKPKEMVLN